MTRIYLLAALMLMLWSGSPLVGQEAGTTEGGEDKASEKSEAKKDQPPSNSGGGLQERFEKNAPDVGQPLPELTALDPQGQPFPLADLRGSHTVLVFGCLT